MDIKDIKNIKQIKNIKHRYTPEDRELTEQEIEDLIAHFDRESNVRKFTGIYLYVMRGLLLLFAAFVVWTTLFITLPEQVRRSAFVGIMVFIGYLYYPFKKGWAKKVNYIPWYDFVLAIVGSGAFFYYVFNFDAIIGRAAIISQLDVIVAVVGILLLAELCRRAVGLPIVIVAAAFIFYAFVHLLSFGDSFYSVLRRIVNELFYTTNGIIGIPIGVASTFIVLFIFLAAFLEKSGIAHFFIDFANSIAGASSGGPAKVAVIASALEGMISGSSVANTVGSGSVTIPVMKKAGYKPEFAAAVEAAASTGGQIVPPILGAAAFIMAEITGIPYMTIAVAAIFPAVLYFTGVFLMVHFEAKKTGLQGLPKDTLPKFGKLLLTRGYLLSPIVVLVVLMDNGFTPAFAACWAIVTVWVVTLFRKDTRFTPKTFTEAVVGGSRNTIGVGIACAVAGTIVGIVTLTGLGQLLISQLGSIVANVPVVFGVDPRLFVALLITMVACLILGMGVPTTAKYVIMATITAPMILRAAYEIGVLDIACQTEMLRMTLAAHMFVFYFGILADIPPPVALAAYAGAAIANSNPIRTSIDATKLAVAAFIIPFVFVFSPEILFPGDNPLMMIKVVLASVLGMFNIAIGIKGYMLQRVSWPLRIIAITAGFMLIDPSLLTSLIGFGVSAVIVTLHVVNFKKPEIVKTFIEVFRRKKV